MPDDSRIGAVLAGKYELTRLHGRGAFGAVYEASNVEIGKRVAVKLIEPQYVRNEEVVARFRVEARAASRVESEHIVQVFDVGHDPDHGLFMVMELLQGEDLAARLDREFKLSPAVAVHIAVQAARALAKAHAAGVVHRDLKPANVFLITREDGSLLVKLVDFGISKILSEDARAAGSGARAGDRALTRMGTVVGTPNYMSPEQARGLPVDGRTDVWSLGAVLYEMLAGAPCYPHEWSYEETIIAIATGPEPRILEVAPWVPKEVAAVVDAALTRDLERRIPDCATFATMLGDAMPQAARPRREESLYMEPSDFSDEPPREPTREQIEQTVAIASDHPLPERANTTVAVARPRALEPEHAQKPVWPWIVVLLLALSAAAAFAAYRAGWIRPPDAEPAAAAPAPGPSASASLAAAAPKPTAPRPIVQKPKPSATASASAAKTITKTSSTAKPKKP
ncbi:MAG: serine/threonine protein kinase [Deltaproteobacteria bacterium]|nr:serine/threonine protein kinase [Deltaproteobacteria bacterium]